MMEIFTTWAEDHYGNEHEIIVEYNFIPPRPATLFDPPEGGVEIEAIHSPFELTQHQIDIIEDACVEEAFRRYYEGDME